MARITNTVERKMTDENGETLKFQGQSSLVNFIKENKVIYEEIKSKVYDCIK